MPRTRGAVSGVLLMILGAWGALVPLVGPYFNFVIGPDDAWNLTTGRWWLSLLPGLVVFVGGLLLLLSANRASGGFGGWLALVGGIWFVIGEQMSELWNNGVGQAGQALGGTTRRVVEHLAYFDAVGALTIAISAFALGRLAVRSARDVELARAARGDDEDLTRTRRRGRFGRTGRDRYEREPAATAAPPDSESAARRESS